jgi:LysW-gamma-L-lysine carboxypeptidase
LRHIQTDNDGLRDRATATGSLRLPPDIDNKSLTDFLVTSALPACVAVSGFEPAYSVDRQNPLVARLAASIRKHGGTAKYKLKTGTSDMNVVGPIWNCPIIAYGPGDSGLDHTPDEHIALSEFDRGIEVLCALIESQ